MFNGSLFLLSIFIGLAAGILAARKGYSFWLWIFVGVTVLSGITGLVILAFLPFVNKGGLSAIEVRERTKTGNIIGGVFAAIALVQIALLMIALIMSAPTPKMSGVSISGRQLTQAEWDACNHNDITCLNMYPN